MDVRLDQAVTVTDSYRHHRVHSDPVGGQMTKHEQGLKIRNILVDHSSKPLSNTCVLTGLKWNMLPVGIFFGVVTTKAQVKVFTHIAVDPAAYDEPLAVVTGIFHVHHFMIILMAFRLRTTWSQIKLFV